MVFPVWRPDYIALLTLKQGELVQRKVDLDLGNLSRMVLARDGNFRPGLFGKFC